MSIHYDAVVEFITRGVLKSARRLNAPKLAAEIDDVVSDVVGKADTFTVA